MMRRSKKMDKILLCSYGEIDFIFEIENKKELENAIKYKNEKILNNDFCMSDFEYILEYLENNNIQYNYTAISDIEQLEY
jgi:hypothetical protein